MNDQEKFKKLFDELGIEYEENGNTLFINTFNCDGAREFGISFWDGDYYPEGSYHEFWVVPDTYCNTVATLKDLRWVDSSKQLPQYSGLYLVSIGNLVTTANFDGTEFRNRGMMRICVDAWQVLPKSFKTIGDSKND